LPASTDRDRVRGAGAVLGKVALAAVGIVTALAGFLVARAGSVVGHTLLPWGLVLTLATTVAVTLGGARLAGFGGALAVALGWFGTVGAVVLVSPGGDQLIGSDWLGVAFLGLGVVAVGVVVIRELARSRSAA
jgi:hypothetical protein